MKNVIGVIPARYASTRLPAKPLALILGKPMVQWVYEAAQKALPRVIVATDDKRIAEAVGRFGGQSMLTPTFLQSGTERMAWVARKLRAEYYVNIQGDEPMIHPKTIRAAVQMALKKRNIATVATTLHSRDFQKISVVKVVVGAQNQAIYFSRAPIPCVAHGVLKPMSPYKHLGIYVYPKHQLQQFVRWKPTPLELTEKLEQLRALYYGAPIFVALTPYDSIGVDTPSDLKSVSQLLSRT